ncbi:potassium channel family protein [Pontibacter akesuensis]|uniref:Trk K+ transport system, NAD-binding component n=1 Tax=Pontibacter akesuensis TaxID=388950 RepID=A0A1I7KTE2_9BACT|nr:NAD-binding protein [Pontibacter akesuensis]GHA80747.1 potassium transporter [Pontibacter akesuensis]SFV00668.1 Trk K+ transport system, NAD-binding component [Pontibacter akesuensis]
MKFLPTQLLVFLKNKPERRNLKLLGKFLLVLLVLVVAFTVIFHLLMIREGETYSWITGFYWTLTVMSTLGFGDITFHSDAGRFFSIVVLLSGMVFLLILFPFTFINFFYSPWMKAQEHAQVPRELPDTTRGHVVLTSYGAVSEALIKKLNRYQYDYVVLVPDLAEGLRLHELGVRVMLGDQDDPETYNKVRVQSAALVATTSSDVKNTNVAFTVRGLSSEVPIISTCSFEASEDIMKLAGSNHVLRLGEIMGLFLARRASGGDARAHPIGKFGELQIAEASVAGSNLVGLTLRETKLRELVGVSVVGIWERGKFRAAQPNTKITTTTVLVLAGSDAQIEKYNQMFQVESNFTSPVVIIGGGRVGRSTGRALAARNMEYRIVEKDIARVKNDKSYILGDAAELEVLKQAGIEDSPCVIITTHDDDMNVYLTIYCRRLRPDIQIITRTTLERNLATMHRAGADFVMSYASMGANTMFNLLKRSDILMIAEGLDLLKVPVPAQLAGRSIADSSIRQETGCTIIAIRNGETTHINPEPNMVLPAQAEIILIGTVEAENKFFKLYGPK